MAVSRSPPFGHQPTGFYCLLGNANPLEPNTIHISLTWRNFDVFEWLAFAARSIYLGRSHSPPLLQNCTSDCARPILPRPRDSPVNCSKPDGEGPKGVCP